MNYDAIIIGTGFGGAVAATKLAERNKRVLMLERGVWWYSPERPLPPLIRQRSQGNHPEQPVQYWPRPNSAEGLISLLSMVQTNSPLENLRHFAEVVRSSFSGKLDPQPLYRATLFPDVAVVTGTGVGGGSLVYADVTMEPYWDEGNQTYPVTADWPVQLDRKDYADARAWMEHYRGQLNRVVTTIPLPPGSSPDVANLPPELEFLYLGKARALRHAAQHLAPEWKQKMVRDWEPLELAITEYDGPTKPGTQDPSEAVKQRGAYCLRQGRCILGCLPGARHSLGKTLIDWLLDPPQPRPKPAVELRSLADVDHIAARAGGGYDVVYRDLRDGRELSVSADSVILAAGCLGSTELLLRSSAGGHLRLSDTLGSRFSTNGDLTGFAVVGDTAGPDNPLFPIFPTRGPINTSHVMFQDGSLHVTVEDGGIPAMFAGIAGAALHVLKEAAQREPFMKAMRGGWLMGQMPDLDTFFPHLPDPSNPKRFATEDEKVANVFWFNCMGTDGATGRFSLDDAGRLDLDFYGAPTVAGHPVFDKIESIMKAMAEAMGGTYLPFPLWEGLTDRKLVTIFPLGGCPIGGSSTDGVVDADGRVFDTRSGAESVHQGLSVMDSSVIPGPLAVQPSLTIVALALKMAAAMP